MLYDYSFCNNINCHNGIKAAVVVVDAENITLITLRNATEPTVHDRIKIRVSLVYCVPNGRE